MTQSRDSRCQYDTATSLQGENFRPLQNATMSSNNNDKNNKDQQTLQTVQHCTSEDFLVTVYDQDDQ